MLLWLGLLFAQASAEGSKQCLVDALSDVGACAFQSCAAYTDNEVLKAQLAQCQGGSGGGGALARKTVYVHRPGDSKGFMFGTLASEKAFEDLRKATADFFGHDDDHTYDYTAEGLQVTEDVSFDFGVSDDESLANFLTTMDRLDKVGVLTAMKVTNAPTQSPSTAPTEPVLPNVEFPERTKFWDVIGVESFEEDVGTWTSRNSYVPTRDCDGPPGGHGAYDGECALKFTYGWGRMFSGSLNTATFPWMCMASWMKSDATAINMLVNVSGVGWRSIQYTWKHWERSVSYPRIGDFPAKADGNWNYECLDLKEITGGKVIAEMIFHWPVDFEYPYVPRKDADERSLFWIDAVSFSDLDPTIEHRGSFLRNPTDQPTSAPTEPVVPLAIWSEGTLFHKINDYEDGVDGWTNRNSFIPVQDCDLEDKYQGKCALKFDKGYGWGRMLSGTWNTQTHPWFCTGYKIPANNDGINMLANVSGWGWRSIEWTWKYWSEKSASYARIGAFEGLKNDGKWRHGCFNMAALTGNRAIQELIFHWPTNHKYPYVPHKDGNDAKVFWLDDTTISNQQPTDYDGPEFGGGR